MTPTLIPLTLRGRWLAITAATGVLQLSYWLVVVGTSSVDGAGVGAIALGLGLVPFVLLATAFGSRHPRAPGAALRAMGWFLLVGLPLGLAVPAFGVRSGSRSARWKRWHHRSTSTPGGRASSPS